MYNGRRVRIKTEFDRNEYRLVEREGDEGLVINSYVVDGYTIIGVEFEDTENFDYDEGLVDIIDGFEQMGKDYKAAKSYSDLDRMVEKIHRVDLTTMINAMELVKMTTELDMRQASVLGLLKARKQHMELEAR